MRPITLLIVSVSYSYHPAVHPQAMTREKVVAQKTTIHPRYCKNFPNGARIENGLHIRTAKYGKFSLKGNTLIRTLLSS